MQTKRKIEDEESRRHFWSEQMDAAYEFMLAIREYPIKESGEPVVSLVEAVNAAGVNVTFSDSKIAKDFDRVYFLREGLMQDFVNAAREMNQQGWILKVEDGYRSLEMQTNLGLKESVLDFILQTVIWECQGEIPDPDFLFRRLSVLVATHPKNGTHISASAIDISVFREDDSTELDRGGPYLEMSEVTPMNSPFISAEAAKNRLEITELMARHNFVTYPFEFWHYNSGDAYAQLLSSTGEPSRYGPVDIDLATGSVTPVLQPDQLLHTLETVQRELDKALERYRLRQGR